MLTPEIALIAATGAILVSLMSCLLMLSARRQMNRRLDEFKLELDVHLSANYEMARQLRALQISRKATRHETSHGYSEEELGSDDTVRAREDYRYEAPESVTAMNRSSEYDARFDARQERSVDREPIRESGLSLAEKLGLSQSEADIVTHLRPRKRGVQESA